MNSRNQFFFQRRTLLSAALGAAAFSAIGTPLTVFAAAESDPAQQLDRIKKAGVIRIGTEGVFVPYSYHDEQGRLTGYDPKSRSKRSRYSSKNDVLIEKSVKYTDFFLLLIVYA